MTILVLLLGFLFGAILQYAKLNRYNVISGMATLENYAVAKAIATAIGIGAIIIAIEIGLGFASYHIKPILLGGIAIGGINSGRLHQRTHPFRRDATLRKQSGIWSFRFWRIANYWKILL